jgi:nodulation protein E
MPQSPRAERRRVVVTGLGVLSAIGCDTDQFWDSLVHGRSGIRPIESVDVSGMRFQNGAEVRGFNATDYLDAKQASLLDRFAQFAVVAARLAVNDSAIQLDDELRSRTAIVTGCAVGGQSTMDDGFVDLYKKGSPRVNPMMIPRVMGNSGASNISMDLGITGPTYNVSTACSSSNHAIGQAYWMVRSGVVDAAITGGAEAVFSYGMLKSWEAMRVVAPDTCRPFSKDRKGLILGEGGAMLVLESLDAALARGAKIYGEIAGFGMSSDAHHITQPSADGAADAIRRALDDAQIGVVDIGYVNAHGTGTTANDITESAALRKVFGERTSTIPVSSTKSMHGHALGAAGAFEAVATLMAARCGLLPPTANFTEADPQCDIDVISGTAREARIDAAVSNSFAFGGLNAVLVFRRV